MSASMVFYFFAGFFCAYACCVATAAYIVSREDDSD